MIHFKKYQNFLSKLIIAYCLTLMITFNRTIQIVDVRSFLKLFQTDAVTSGVIFLLSIYFFSNFNLSLLKVREHKVVTVFSLFFSIFHVIGSDVTYTHSTFRGIVNKFSILAFLILTLISYVAINTLLRLLINWFRQQNFYSPNIEENYFRKKLYILMLLPFLIIRILLFLVFFPGSTTWDSMYTIQEGLGYWPLTNSHPYIYTWVVSLFSKLGIKYFGSLGIGVSIFNFLTLIITSVVVVFVLYKFFEIFHINICLKIGLFLFYAFFSDFIIMSFALYKDVYLVNFLLLFFLSMVLMIYLPRRFF